jgi:serine/threonine protein kinase
VAQEIPRSRPYAAPEQLTDEPIDGHADQYALAATAFHLLTGSPLFPHSNPAVVISRHLSAPPPKPALPAPPPTRAMSKKSPDTFQEGTVYVNVPAVA